jgi:hypothetical protein
LMPACAVRARQVEMETVAVAATVAVTAEQ